MTKWLLTLAAVVTVIASPAAAGVAASTPVGALPKGPVSTTSTQPGLLVAVALPRTRFAQGYVWRIARRFNSSIVREVSEADVGKNVVLIFRIVGRGSTALVFGMTRGDTSPTAVQSFTYRIHSA
jgi:CO/xanthine dehydrogenase FAD-binding subunit